METISTIRYSVYLNFELFDSISRHVENKLDVTFREIYNELHAGP
jgi:hypothetical protein